MPYYKRELETNGFAVISNLYSKSQIDAIASAISLHTNEEETKATGVYALRKPLQAISALSSLLFTDALKEIVNSFGEGYFLSKSIYFNKPSQSNWFVAYHQDLTLNLKEKYLAEGFINWVDKGGYYSVHPPVGYLENTLTVRIHLDETTKDNGALWVKPKSHQNGVVRFNNDDWENDVVCEVNAGGAMLMRPLLLHASKRTTNNFQRRVIHLEFCNMPLPDNLAWEEKVLL